MKFSVNLTIKNIEYHFSNLRYYNNYFFSCEDFMSLNTVAKNSHLARFSFHSNSSNQIEKMIKTFQAFVKTTERVETVKTVFSF